MPDESFLTALNKESAPRDDGSWLTSPHVQAWCDKERKYAAMKPADYDEQLTELIEQACCHLDDKAGDAVLAKAFNLIWVRLGLKIDAKVVLPKAAIPGSEA